MRNEANGDTAGKNGEQAAVSEKPYTGVNREAQKLAELGTLALVGHYPSEKQMLEEIHRLEKDPVHMKAVAADLAKINQTKDGLPVHASVEVDGSGNVAGLKFENSKELEKIVYGNERRYEECVAEKGVRVAVPVFEAQMEQGAKNVALEAIMANGRSSCKELDVPATAVTQIPSSHEFVVLNKPEQQVLSAIKTAMNSHNEAALNDAVKPYVGGDWRSFMRIVDTDAAAKPYSYSLNGSNLNSMYFQNGAGGFFRIDSQGS